MDPVLKAKYISLCSEFKSREKVAIAFSGGVDSTLLLQLAKEAIADDAIAITIISDFYPSWELSFAKEAAERLGIKHKLIEIDPLALDEIASNPPDRCYTCKKIGFTLLKDYAESRGYNYICDGSCLDDLKDYRPGFRAIQELGIHSPFIDFDLTKQHITELSKELNISGWFRPSCACLASRIPFNQEITKAKLQIVEQAEEFLHTLNIPEARVRLHNDIARIEVFEKNFDTVAENREIISDYIKSLGVDFVCIELESYKSGSLNRSLDFESEG